MTHSPDREGIDRILGEKWRCRGLDRKLDFMLPGSKGLSNDDKAYYAALLADLPPLTKGMTDVAIRQFLDAYRAHPSANLDREPWLLHPLDVSEFNNNVDRQLDSYEDQINREIKEGRLTGRQISESLFPCVESRTLYLNHRSQLPREPIIRYFEVLGFVATDPEVQAATCNVEASIGHEAEAEPAALSGKAKQRNDAVRRLMNELRISPPPGLGHAALLDFSSEALRQMIEKIEQGKSNRSLRVWKGLLYATRLSNPAPWPNANEPPFKGWTLIDPENICDRLSRRADRPEA